MINAKKKGTGAERELIAFAIECGAHASRNAGSLGAYDVCVTLNNGLRYLVNIKCNDWPPPHERARLLAYRTPVDRPLLARRLDRKGWSYRDIDREGRMGPIYSIAPWQ